jgi:hypothetical protein
MREVANSLRDVLDTDDPKRTATQRARLEGALTVLELLLGDAPSLVNPAMAVEVAKLLYTHAQGFTIEP